ncbi:MAG TPA: DUF5107 domain-containing protein [Verrucomicrobiae bacterium]|nr:DUF5107 domain-containing protein [Verrucomicrobiae bacterium]
MPAIQQNLELDGVPIVRMESAHLQVGVVPSVGGRIVSIIDKRTGHEFLWRNQALRLELKPSGTEYDPNFYGGIDELLPNDLAEPIIGIDCPDHGELWTTPLQAKVAGDHLILHGRLARFGLEYHREMHLRAGEPWIDFKYRIANTTQQSRDFLWKLHAAVAVQEGDVIECPARRAQIVDPAWSRFKTREPFKWPEIEGRGANIIPAKDGTMDFFYLFDLAKGEMFWCRPKTGLKFGYQFDTKIFPFAWLFASYGGFLDHYTIILEPCTAMPMSVKDAAAKAQCSRLEPGQVLDTIVSLYAGPA